MARVNLVPRSERPRTTTDVGLLAMVALLIVVFFGIGFGYYLLLGVRDDREQELADLKQQTAALQAQVAALEQYERLETERQDAQAVVQGIYASRTLVAEILDAISLVVPENVWFQSLALSTSDPSLAQATSGAPATSRTSGGDNVLRIEGQTYAFEDVARAVVRLQLIPALRNVELSSAARVQEAAPGVLEVKSFTLDASVVNVHGAEAVLPLGEVEVAGP
jgi:Tfp pilus assembly protein PilN